jgi:precorrin-6Y C5,15-methyltransferase (decarboxylating)
VLGGFEGDVITVIGIGADGWRGLTEPSRQALRDAEVIVGAPRHLSLLDGRADVTAQLALYPSPLMDGLPAVIAQYRHAQLAMLASGDPMMHGIGSTLVRLVGPDKVRVLPAPSALSLACARLGWPVEDVDVVSVVSRPLSTIHPTIQPGRRVLVLSRDATTPTQVAELLTTRGFGDSLMTVLERLGDEAQRVTAGQARHWSYPAVHALNVVAIECRADKGATILPRLPGLPDEAFEHDGQLTKRDMRAITLARLGPVAGRLLWDVGAGAGSVAIEWMRSHPACQAVAVEVNADRAARIRRNAQALGVPSLEVVVGRAPQALGGLPRPDAVFVGGGASEPGVLDACWGVLPAGGQLVVNGVTLETEAMLADWYRRYGGELLRFTVSRARPVGTMTGWSSAMPVTQWVGTRQEDNA